MKLKKKKIEKKASKISFNIECPNLWSGVDLQKMFESKKVPSGYDVEVAVQFFNGIYQ